MSTIKSSDEHLTLNADGSSKDIKFQANGVEKASISSAGAFTSTTIDATALTGDLPAISGASLTGLPNGSQLDYSGTKTIEATSGGALIGGTAGAKNLTVESTSGAGTISLIQLKNSSDNFNIEVGRTVGALTIRDNTNGERLKLDSTGAVTIPSQPAFLAWSNANATIANNTWTDIQFATERFDTGSDFNSATGIFTAPVTGKYQINYNVRIDGIAASVAHASVQIYTSNQDYAYQTIITPTAYDSILNYHSFNGSLLVDMDANDTAKLRALINGSTGNYGGWLGTTFSAHLVC